MQKYVHCCSNRSPSVKWTETSFAEVGVMSKATTPSKREDRGQAVSGAVPDDRTTQGAAEDEREADSSTAGKAGGAR